MKTKVPEVGVVVDVSPVADPRKKRIHLYQLRGLGRELRGICVCDHQADVVADDARLRDAEGASEGVNANRGGFHVHSIGGNIRVADSGQIRDDQRESLRQFGHYPVPHARGLSVPVQKDQRWTGAASSVIDPGAVNRCGVANKCRALLGGIHSTRRSESCHHQTSNQVSRNPHHE